MNNIDHFTPDGWFEECHGIKGGKKNNNGIYMTYNLKVTFKLASVPSLEDLVLSQLGETVQKEPTSLHILFFLS